MSVNNEIVRKKLVTLLENESMVDKYIKKFGSEINIKNLKQIKDEATVSFSQVTYGEGEEPLYSITVRCPVCQLGGIECHELKSKSQAIVLDKFLIPSYSGCSGFKTANYDKISVTVCTRCFFASPDKKDFITYSVSTHHESPSQMSMMVISQLKNMVKETVYYVGKLGYVEGIFDSPRSNEGMRLSFKLAIRRVESEIDLEQENSLYKAGAYALKIAKNLRESSEDDEEALKVALKFYEKSFKISNTTTQDLENQIIYVIVALNLRLKMEKKAREYLTALEKIKQDLLNQKKDNPSVKTASAENWVNKAKTLWEDKDLPDLWV